MKIPFGDGLFSEAKPLVWGRVSSYGRAAASCDFFPFFTAKRMGIFNPPSAPAREGGREKSHEERQQNPLAYYSRIPA